MAVGVQLQQLVKDVRAEIGHSLSVAQGQQTREKIQYLLRRTQTELHTAHDWPRLSVRRDVDLHAGTRVYDFPADVSFEHAVSISYKNGTEWVPLGHGIGDTEFNQHALGEEVSPAQKWDYDADNDQIEIWPVPPENITGGLRVWGTKALGNFIAETDVSTLDGTLLTLFVAAEMLAKQKSEDAQVKLTKAQDYLRKLLDRSVSRKSGVVILGGGSSRQRQLRPYRDYIPRS